MQMNGWGGWGGGGQGGSPQNMFMNMMGNMMGRQQQPYQPQTQQPQYQVGQNAAVDSNAPFRQPMQAGDYVGANPYGMNQSNQSRWNGNGWTSTSGTPVQQGGGPNPNAQDMAKKMQWQQQGQMDPAQQQGPTLSAQQQKPQWSTLPGQGPYTMPGGPAQIYTIGGGMNGPRPQQPPTGPRGNMPNLNPNQLAALQPGSMGRPPGMGIGPGGPTRNVPGFQPNAWQGFGRGNIQNPYQPQGQNRGW